MSTKSTERQRQRARARDAERRRPHRDKYAILASATGGSPRKERTDDRRD